MTADTKRLHVFLDDRLALLASVMRSGLLIVGGGLSACREWLHGRIAEIRSRALLERQLQKKTAGEKEVWLAGKLQDPVEATLLVDDRHRLVGANQIALAMLGISERNIHKFTMDSFVSCSESGFAWKLRPSLLKKEKWRICKVRRFDGGPMVAEFTFQANVSPGRHLTRFRNVVSCRHVPSQISRVSAGARLQ